MAEKMFKTALKSAFNNIFRAGLHAVAYPHVIALGRCAHILTRRALQAVRPRNRPVTIPSKVKFPRTMTSKGVKVQSKVTFDKPVTGFFALLQGGTSCFARRAKDGVGARKVSGM